jgi:hypothetical protein
MSAIASGYILFRLRSKDQEGQQLALAWRLGEWFCWLMLCGSCVGCITWAAWMQHVIHVVTGDDLSTSNTEYAATIALAYRWSSAFVVTYAFEFFCLSVAKLMVLDRMSNFATPQQTGGSNRRWDMAGRILTAIIFVGNAVGLAGNIASAVYFKRASEHFDYASAFYAVNNTVDAVKSFQAALTQLESGAEIFTVQAFCEVAVLLVIVIAFAVVGFACSARIKTTLLAVRRMEAEYLRTHQASPMFAQAQAEGMQLRLRILGSTAFVFAAFVLRSIFAVMRAVAYQMQNLGNSCPGVLNLCDPRCYNEYTHFSQWMFRTPEFQLTVMLISSPVALLVALRGMTNKVITQREIYAIQLGTVNQSGSIKQLSTANQSGSGHKTQR